MKYKQIIFETGKIARIKMNRPRYYNALSRILLDEIDDAFKQAIADDEVKVIILSGEGKHFSAGHDLGTPEELADQPTYANSDGTRKYIESRRRFIEMGLRWRDLPKPTISMVQGYCIFGGWMVATAMDILFAADSALFLPSHFQYFSTPWDIGPKKTKEILFEHRFMTSAEACEKGFVNRVISLEKLEVETVAYAQRVAENDPLRLRLIKQSVNHMMDTMGFRNEIEADFQTYFIQENVNNIQRNPTDPSLLQPPNLARVDLALTHLKAYNQLDT